MEPQLLPELKKGCLDDYVIIINNNNNLDDYIEGPCSRLPGVGGGGSS